jgi:hypothetical protein
MRCRDPGDEISDDDYFYPDSVGSIGQLIEAKMEVPKREFPIGFDLSVKKKKKRRKVPS